MQIKELAKVSGQKPATIRYYEEIGLLPPAARSRGNYRIYGAVHVERLAFIRRCRALDMTLERIRFLIDVLQEPDSVHADEVHGMLSDHIAEVDARINELVIMRSQLVALTHRCSGVHEEGASCPVMEALREGDKA